MEKKKLKETFYFKVDDPTEVESAELKIDNSNVVPPHKKLNRIAEDFPQGQLYEVIGPGANRNFNLSKYLGYTYDYSGGSLTKPDDRSTNYGSRLDNVESILGKVKIEKGDIVEVAFYDRSRQRPYIKRLFKKGIANPDPTSEPEAPPVEPPEFTSGMWLQQRGFWWQPNHNREAIPRFNLSIESFNAVDEPMWKFVENEDIPGQEGVVVLFQRLVNFTSHWEVKKNGVIIKQGEAEPGYIPDVFFKGNTIIGDDGQPTGNYTRVPEGIPPGLYDLFVFKGTDYSGTYTASYQTTSYPKSIFRPDEIDDATKNTLAFKGLVLFPDAERQNISILTPHFEVEGPNIQEQTLLAQITFVERGSESFPSPQIEGQFFYCEYTPSEVPLNFTGDPFLDDFSINFRFLHVLFSQIDTNLFGLKVGMLEDCHPHFYYSYRDNEEEVEDTISVDGSSQSILIKPNITQYISHLDEDLEVPSYEITVIETITVNDEDDELAYFSNGEIIISIPLEPGDTVYYKVNGYNLLTADAFFTTTTDQSDFVITTPAGPGTLSGINFFHQGNSGPDSGTDTNWKDYCYILPGTNTVRLMNYFYPGNNIEFNYKHLAVIGDYYKTSEMRVYELGGNYSGIRVIKTPIPQYTLNPAEYSGLGLTHIKENEIAKFRESCLFLDPNTKTYTIVSPSGLIWRSRSLLTEPAPAIANPKVHYKFTPWPEEQIAQDWYNFNPEYGSGNPAPEVLVKNREHPWYNFSCGGPYGMQGGWNRYGGVTGDSQQKLRLWKRSTLTYEWINHVNLDLFKLYPADINTTAVPRISGVGRTDFYNRISTHGISATLRHGGSHWPLSKNYNAWIVAAPFIVEDFTNESPRDPLQIGWIDAGLTFNAISPETGEILAQYTIRGSKEFTDVLPVFEDPMARLEYLKTQNNESLLQSIDKYYNNNRYYYGDNPEMELKPPFDGQNTVTASYSWATVPWDSGTIWRMYIRQTGFATESPRILNYPGVPSMPTPDYFFSSTLVESNQLLFNTYDRPNTNSNLNITFQPNIIMDEEDNIYLSLYMPYWQRRLNIGKPGVQPTAFVERTATVFHAGGESDLPYARWLVYFIGDSGGGGVNLCDGVVTATVNGNPTTHNYPGNDTGFLVPYRYEHVYVNGTLHHYDDRVEPPRPVYLIPDATIQVTWRQPDVTGWSEFYSPTNNFEYPSFVGYQVTPMPTQGMVIKSVNVEHSPEYVAVAKAFLFKLHYDKDAKTITEKWRKDISQMINWNPTEFSFSSFTPVVLPSSKVADIYVNWTIPCGRYIFVIKDNVRVNPTATTSDLLSIRKSVVEVYKNLDTVPTLFKFMDLPNTTTEANPSLTLVARTVFATADIQSGGQEHLFLKIHTGRAFSILMPLEEAEDPSIQTSLQHYTSGEPDFPDTPYDCESMVRAADSYYWVDLGNNIKKRELY